MNVYSQNWEFKLIVNKLLNSLIEILNISDANDVMITGDVTENVARLLQIARTTLSATLHFLSVTMIT